MESNNSGRPLVSINCITYNHEKYIGEALSSFLSQKCSFPYEIVIHDDASTDRTAEIIKEYEAKFPEIFRPLYQKDNQYSQGRAINDEFNYPRARGKYIAYCEGDDFWIDPYKLEKQVKYMEDNPDCSLCFHAVDDVDPVGNVLRRYEPFNDSRKVTLMDIALAPRTFTFASFMFKREDMINPPEFYRNCPVGDVPLLWLMATKGHIYYMKDCMACYRNNVSGSWDNELWKGNYLPKFEKHTASMLNMLDNFDEYTGLAYPEEVKTGRLKLEFELFMAREDFKILRQKKYREFYRHLSWRARVGAFIGQYSLPFYKLLKGFIG